MKKILIVGMTTNLGGIESCIMNYYRNINKNLFHFDFLCNSYNKIAYEAELLESGSKIVYHTTRRKNYFKYKKEINAFFKNNSKYYDAIWINLNNISNIDYLKLAKKYGIKKRIIHAHNSKNMGSFFSGVLHRINRYLIKKYATDFWACSYVAAKWAYCNKNLLKEVKIIPNAVDVDKFIFDESKRSLIRKKIDSENSFLIGNIGRLDSQKNQTFILDIYKYISEKETNSKFIFVGQGGDEILLKNKAKELKIFDKCLFAGMQQDIQAWLSAFDSFLFPSLFEGFGIAAIEAQCSGLPCFISDGVPNEAMLCNTTKISLKKSAKEWAEIILEKVKNFERKDCSVLVKKAGFDIKDTVIKIEKLLNE